MFDEELDDKEWEEMFAIDRRKSPEEWEEMEQKYPSADVFQSGLQLHV